ncbi:DUF2397 family protein [Nocardiopsis rhodophaea]|uniref:DUF2397 family protein n=1 Tax=Nocardiopsis rhodophaea TaxID=280238 RepID=UPI0031D8EFE6
MGDSANQATTAAADGGAARASERAGETGVPVPRHGRAALLRLASWFEAAETDTAHELFTAAFALHSARHLGGAGEEAVAATTSWWDAPIARTAALRLTSALPAAPIPDHTDQQARLRDAAESSAHWRRTAAQELRRVLAEPTGDDARPHLSSLALEVLMELLTAALSAGDATFSPVSAGDLELGIRLHVQSAPAARITLRGADGDLALDGLRMQITAYSVDAGADADTDESDGTDDTAVSGTTTDHCGLAGLDPGIRLVRQA